MIPPTHLIDFVLSKIFVDMAGSIMRCPISGGGKHTVTRGVRSITTVRRFITPIFLHAGFLHIGLNMLAQLTASAQVSITAHAFRIIGNPCAFTFQIEREMGSGGFFVVYFAAGIFG